MPSEQNLIVNGGFEADRLGEGANTEVFESLLGWTAIFDRIAIQNGTLHYSGEEDNQVLQLDPDDVFNTRISQVFNVPVSGDYLFRFNYATYGDNPDTTIFHATVGGVGEPRTGRLVEPATEPGVIYEYSEIVSLEAGANSVEFFEYFPPGEIDGVGALIDNVSVTAINDPVESDFILKVVNTTTNNFIADLFDGSVVDASGLGASASERSITADYIGDGVAGDEDGSIVFELTTASGDVVKTQTESFLPYALFGDGGGSFNGPSPALVDGDYKLTVTAYANNGASGQVLGTQTIDFTFGEAVTETLSLAIEPASVSEAGGSATATVTRTGDTTSALVVSLAVSDGGEASAPTSVTIEAGQTSATFTIDAVDDALADGEQTAAITASATGFTSATQTLTVEDDEVAALTLTIDEASILEGGSATATVSRNTPTDSALVVTLVSSDETEASTPSTVTILAGETQASFSITGVADGLLDGPQSVSITASAPGLADSVDSLDIIDADTGVPVPTTTTASTDEDTELVGWLEATNPTGDALLFSLAEGGGASNGSVTVFDDGSFIYTPNPDFNGQDSFAYAVSDGTDTVEQTVTVTVNPINDAPEEFSLGFSVIPADSAPIAFQGFINPDWDIDSVLTPASLSFSNVRLDDVPISGLAEVGVGLDENGVFTIAPADIAAFQSLPEGVSATVRFVMSIFDGEFTTDINGVISIRGVNDAPVAVTTAASTDEDTELAGQLEATDIDGDDLTFGLAQDGVPANGSVDIADDGSFTYAPNPGFNGEDSFTYAVSDGTETVEQTVAVSVTAINDPVESDFILKVVNTTTNNFIADLFDGSVVDASGLGASASERSITADYIGDGVAGDEDGSIVFELTTASGEVVRTQTESFLPYALFGDGGGSFNGPSPALVDGDYKLTVTAYANNGASGEVLGTQTIDFTFGEAVTETLSLAIEPATVSEAGGRATATVTRTGDTTSALTVFLANSDTSEASTPTSVTIEAGQTSATFTIDAVDDALADGEQTAAITASATGFTSATQTLTVEDDEVAALTLTIDEASILEGGSATATVSRNTPTDSALVVTLASSDETEATTPSTVTIPAGETQASFSITGVADGELDGPQTVSITASAPGLADSVDSLNIVDADTGVPVPTTTAASTDEDTELLGWLEATNPTGDALLFSLAEGGGASNGSVTVFDDGSFIYTPNPDFNGEDTFTYVALNPGEAAFGGVPLIPLFTLNGSNGFILNGIDEFDFSGASVSGAGDINGDGIDDLIIGALNADPNGNSFAGESYVVFGSSSGFDATLELDSLDGSNGFVLNGIDEGDNSGTSVSGAGDVNGDGIDDLIIGASGADPNGDSDAGESYVVFGSSTGFGASLELDSLDGSNGFVLNGIDERDISGRSVSSAGDVNGDGIDDLIIGASGADPNGDSDAGESYVVFGSSTGFGASLELDSLDGSNGFVLNGIDERDISGRSVSSAGDVNGDGIDDLIIGAFGADPNGDSGAGESYVVFGSSTGFDASLELDSLDGSNGFILNGIDAGDFSGISVSGAGDVNGDGIDDIIIGASQADSNGNSLAGESYVVFGSSSGFNANFELDSLDGSNGFVLNGIDERDLSGDSVSGAGDVNGDGIDDIIIGASGDFDVGESYVVFGSSTGFNSSLDLDSLDGSNGFALNGIDGNDESGESVSGAGDVNGDGIDDLIIGARSADPNGDDAAGESYVVFGSTDIAERVSAPATVTVTVNPINDAPVPVTTTASTDEDTELDGQLEATDVDGDALTFALAADGAPANGTVDIAEDGSFIYTPDPDFNGEDSFAYAVSDGTDTVEQTVAVTVNPVDDPVESDFILTVVNTTTNNFIADLFDGSVVDASGLGASASERSITADYIGDGVAGDEDGSIVFELTTASGDVVKTQTESFLPYALFGDGGGSFNGPSPALVDGDYKLTVTAYANNGASGQVLGTQTIDFTFGDEENTPAPAAAATLPDEPDDDFLSMLQPMFTDDTLL